MSGHGWLGPIAAVLLVPALAIGCTEHLTTPGECPALCPGGQATVRDTVLTPVPGGDSSFSGYRSAGSLVSVLVSSGGPYGEHRAVIRFLPRGDSILAQDSTHAYSVDSVHLELGVQDRDTTVTGFVLELYRLPLRVDTAASFATVDSLMTPDRLIGELPLGQTVRSGVFAVSITGDELQRLAFDANDSTSLEIGLNVRAAGPTAARIGTPASGNFAPQFVTYVTVQGVADSLSHTTIGRIAGAFFTVAPPSGPPPVGVLAVGGVPVSRSFIRFELPPRIRDSSVIIRATLTLTTAAPLIGIPADTALLVASGVLVDFGAKSPVVPGLGAVAPLVPGITTVDLEVVSLVHLWQGSSPTPPIIRLALAQEGGTFIAPLFKSTASVVGQPTLRITYRPPFGFTGF